MSGYWPKAPIRAADGIKARTTRGSIGKSWWSRRFIDVLEGFALGSRLTRGRAYARSGQVLSLAVGYGKVQAEVQGSRRVPYRVTITLATFDEATWRRAESALAAQAIFAARLLAGELPSEIEEVFVGLGAPLFAEGLEELNLRCSCPDWEVPCKHLSAVLYVLAEEFDDDPFAVLHWRGRSRETLLTNLRALRTGTLAETGSPHHDAEQSTTDADTTLGAPALLGAAVALTDLPDTASTDATRFWHPPVPLGTPPAALHTTPDLLMRQLTPPTPSLGGADLTRWLDVAYRRFGDSTLPSDNE